MAKETHEIVLDCTVRVSFPAVEAEEGTDDVKIQEMVLRQFLADPSKFIKESGVLLDGPIQMSGRVVARKQ